MGKAVKTNHYFGGCPHCGENDGMANVSKKHFFFCKAHKTMWSPGTNLFSSAKLETIDYQRKRWNEIGLNEFDVVRPVLPDCA